MADPGEMPALLWRGREMHTASKSYRNTEVFSQSFTHITNKQNCWQPWVHVPYNWRVWPAKMQSMFLQKNEPKVKGNDELWEWLSPVKQLYLAVVSQADGSGLGLTSPDLTLPLICVVPTSPLHFWFQWELMKIATYPVCGMFFDSVNTSLY